MTLYVNEQASIKHLKGETSSLKVKHIDVRLTRTWGYSGTVRAV